jgi:prevent-host-death family protein
MAMDVFTVRDLRERTGQLLGDAEKGNVSLITKHGRPAILAVPFDERLIEHGIHRAMALRLFEADLVSLPKAAKIAGVSVEDFIDLLGRSGIPAVSYSPKELEEELEVSW